MAGFTRRSVSLGAGTAEASRGQKTTGMLTLFSSHYNSSSMNYHVPNDFVDFFQKMCAYFSASLLEIIAAFSRA